jgi:hypothetical protein
MPSWPRKALILSGAAGILVALPALSQNRQAPESLLPPGFGDTKNLPPPEEKGTPQPQRPRPSATPGPVAPGVPSAASPAAQESPNPEEAEINPLERPQPTNYFSIPGGEARPVDMVGALDPSNNGLSPQAFGRTNGLFLGTLMQRIDAPLPSRWTSILLRRALLLRVGAPAGIGPVDWVAARADLLLRMGEADAARLLVQSIDRENFTPRLIEVAARTALATGDPAGLCPLVEPANSNDTVWKLAEAMCAALDGEAARASALVDEAQRRGDVTGIDLLLAQKVIGAGGEARRAAALQWDAVNVLNPWRAGLASATGAEIPPRLINGAPLEIQAWIARAPMIPLEQRLHAASVAASLGVFSSHSLVDAYSLMLDQTDIAETEGTVGARLRNAWINGDAGERLDAMRSLWRESEAPLDRYARLILTAGAAARIPVSNDYANAADNLVASMLSAGMDREAGRWSNVVNGGGNDRAWAMLAAGAPRVALDISAGRVETFIGNDDSPGKRRSQLLIAALAGLGRLSAGDAISLGSNVDLSFGGEDSWTARIDRAARDREPGTVALLAAAGMQTRDWGGVPPQYLFRIVRDLSAVGLEFEARMIAAEAIARL